MDTNQKICEYCALTIDTNQKIYEFCTLTIDTNQKIYEFCALTKVIFFEIYEFCTLTKVILLEIYEFCTLTKYRILRTDYQAKSNEKIDALNAEIYKFVQSIETRQVEIVAKEKEKETIINNLALINNPSAIIALEGKLNALDAEIAEIEKSIKATEREIAKNQRRIADETKSQSIKELQEMTLEGKGEIFKNMLEKVVWVSEKTRRGFLIVTYKNGAEVLWLYKNVRGTRVAMNLPSSFRYNPETFKVAVTLTKRNPNIKFDFGEQIVEEYTPDEMLKSFDFIGNEEWDASDRVWED